MAQRLELHALLKTILGSNNVYFQPPENIQLVYPCIIYNRDDRRTEYADNNPYKHMIRYQIMILDPNPDSDIPEKIADLPMCRFERFYTANQLNHDIYNLFF